jgi:group I intron endonuclease
MVIKAASCHPTHHHLIQDKHATIFLPFVINRCMNIYKITNTLNNKIYIGQTVQKNAKMRWYQHCADANKGKDSHLCNSMRLYGIENFVWEVIDSATTIDELNVKEEQWLKHYQQTVECYNIRNAGGNKFHAKESIEKMKQSQLQAHARRRAQGNDGGWTRKDGGPMLGKSHPKKGKPSKKWTAEAKAKLSLIAKEREARKKLAAKEN